MKFGIKGLLLLLCSAAISQGAFGRVGVGSGGGGDAIVCSTGPTRGVFLADTFTALRNYQGMSRASGNRPMLKDLILKHVRSVTPELYTRVRELVSGGLQWQFINSQLPELDDDDIRLWNHHCSKSQLAIQDRRSKVVTVSRPLYMQLSIYEQELLKFHEAYIQLLPAGENTKPIRQIVASIENTAYVEVSKNTCSNPKLVERLIIETACSNYGKWFQDGSTKCGITSETSLDLDLNLNLMGLIPIRDKISSYGCIVEHRANGTTLAGCPTSLRISDLASCIVKKKINQ